MTASVVTSPIVPLPREVDVDITISRPSSEVATDLSLAVFCTPNVETLPPNNGRFAIASTPEGLYQACGWGPSDTGYWAVNAWASQTPRPQRFAVGRVFTERVNAGLMAPLINDFSSLSAISNGSFTVTISDVNGVPRIINVTPINFSNVQSIQGVANAINVALAGDAREAKANLKSAALTDFTDIEPIVNGSFTVTIANGSVQMPVEVKDIYFAGISTIGGAVTAINTALTGDGVDDPAVLHGGVITDFEAIAAVTDGSLSFVLDNGGGVVTPVDIGGLDFTGADDISAVLSILMTAFDDAGHLGDVILSAEANAIVITAADVYPTMTYPTAGSTGTDVSGLLMLTEAAGATKTDQVITPPSSTYLTASAFGNSIVITADDEYDTISFASSGVDGTDVSGLLKLTEADGAVVEARGPVPPSSTFLTAEVAYGGHLVLTTTTGYTVISYARPYDIGTDVSELLGLTQVGGGQKWDEYEPQGLVEEIRLIREAMAAAGSSPFVISIDRQYRDMPEQKAVADYCEANLWKLAGTFCTNSTTAYNSADTTNICYYISNNSYRSCSAVYSSVIQQYPEIAYVMSLLSTNYDYESKTAKFKGEGITPENITETQYQVLNSRNCNVYTRTGNNSDFFREGKQGATTWWSDSYYGWCNLREDVQVAVFNGLRRRTKTPLTREGQTYVVNDVGQVFQKYEDNNFLADREDIDVTLNVPEIVYKAYEIIPSPIWNSNRETRELAAINVIAFEAGAVHKAIIGIDAYN